MVIVRLEGATEEGEEEEREKEEGGGRARGEPTNRLHGSREWVVRYSRKKNNIFLIICCLSVSFGFPDWR